MSKFKQEKKNLGIRIAQGRIAIDLEQKELAEKLGISVRTLRRYEKGETTPDAITWIKIEHLLNNIQYQAMQASKQ